MARRRRHIIGVLLFVVATDAAAVEAEEAARVTCALAWAGGLNLSPLLSPTLLRMSRQELTNANSFLAPKMALDVEALLVDAELIRRFQDEVSRLRRFRATEHDVVDELPYEVQQCYRGSAGLSFPQEFDFGTQEPKEEDYQDFLVAAMVREVARARSIERAAGPPGCRVLSLGCGDGRWAAKWRAATELGPNDDVTLLDLHEENLRKAVKAVKVMYMRTAASDLNVQTLREALPPGKENEVCRPPFDVVESTLVFHHIEDLPRLLKDLYSLLAPGGTLVLLDVVDTNDLEPVMERDHHGNVPPFHGVEFFRSHEEIKAEVRAVGLEIVEYSRLDPALLFLVAQRADDTGQGSCHLHGLPRWQPANGCTEL
eukprot:gnl/TRDRNA2_/TRDRNA2_44778_c0_seq1.p1 gnl/TRDRNA2_/TRDRNA2_44778_c0~~gnl/TRDRNA2_/TRDRNA2_44778_c0_seq1.p1  ORF type:complete len:371 (-),score=72.55 gnl/TRDRNA2_/TRDRNA2_44778_c0_seq1:186-1298(-)